MHLNINDESALISSKINLIIGEDYAEASMIRRDENVTIGIFFLFYPKPPKGLFFSLLIETPVHLVLSNHPLTSLMSLELSAVVFPSTTLRLE
jgi:hypothetical protein